MPRLDPTKLAPSEIPGKVKVDNSLSMGQRIRKRFRPTDTVKVRNITDVPVTWYWMDEQDENYTIEEGSNVKIIDREDSQVWELGPGAADVLLGSCAYLMIETLFKQTCAMKTGIVLHPLDEREINNFAFDDPAKQEEFIDLVFEGKMTPQMMQEAAISGLGGDFKPKITEHLPALATERDEFKRRTRAQRAEAERRMHSDNSEDLADEFEEAAPASVPPAQETPTGKVDLGSGQVGDLIGDDREEAEAAKKPAAVSKPKVASKV